MRRHFLALSLFGAIAAGSATNLSAAAPAITSATSATTQVGVAFTYQITASNAPASFNASGLPVGLSVDTTSGLVSGTPATAATSTVTLTATNTSGTGTKALTLKVNPATPVISSATSASGQVGITFSYQIVASNTPTSYTATGLPAGLSINGTTGAISGKPTTPGNYSATINAKNAGGTGTASLSISVIPAVPVISSAATATGQVGVSFTYQIVASNTPVSFDAPSLPAGLTVNTGTGAIIGTPTASGVSTVTLSATNAGGTGTKTLTLTINPATPVISSATTANGQVGVTFAYQITASNTPTSYSATGLPAGLSVNATTGAIGGKPTAVGNFSATINAKNAGGTGTATLSITVTPAIPVISSAATATIQVNTPFTYQITASNTPTSFNATGLPAGLSVDSTTGIISGTPTAIGSSTISLSASNAGGTGTKTLTLAVNPPPPVISSATAANGQVGVTFSYQIVASNTPTNYTGTGLPAGLTVNATTGVIGGKPTAAGTFSATINAKNAGGTGTGSLTITVAPATPVISSAATASSQVNVAFNYQITASNTPTSFNATGLPAGLSVDSTAGLISGTPTVTGSSTVTLSAINAGGTGTKTLTLAINPPPPVITSATTANGQVGVAFSYQIVASNTPTNYTGTGLPTGLTVNATTGVIGGKPTVVGTFTATINAKNAGGTGSATLTITTAPATPVINSATSATGQLGVAFTYTITATNAPTSFNATGLPAGLAVDTTTGAITGTPTATGTSTVTLSAANSGGTGTKTVTLKVNPDFPVINSPTTATGQMGVAFSYQTTATFSPTSYAATGLPAGLTINTTTGLISGTPTTAGASTVKLSAKNAQGTGTANLALTVSPPSPVINSPATSTAQVGVVYNFQITASNTPTSFGATGLPAGLSLSAMTGVISGTPTTAGVSTVTLSATNTGGTGSATLTITVNPPAPAIGGSSGNMGQVGATFSYQITATNNPTSYGATGLPPGLSLNTTTGLISGTPTTPGTSTVTIAATNAGGTVTSTITLTVLASLPYVTDFETGDGFTAGSLGGQLGWVVSQGTANIVTTDFSLGAQSVQLLASNPPAVISQTFGATTGETIEFFDFFAKPVAETDPTQATTFQVEGAKFAFALNNTQGQLQFLSGNGAGGGTWTPTAFSIPLGANNQAASWVRLTARLDFTKQTWDLYANAQMVAADVPLINNTSSYLSSFQMQGDAAAASGLDDIFSGPTNPLFADVNNNGIDDAWETAHGLSLTSDNRNTSLTGNGVTVLQAYLTGTDPTDFYNGSAPSLTIVGGNNQTADPGQFNAQPFDVGVWNAAGTAPLVNAPVSFTVQSGGGLVATTNTGTPALSSTVYLNTDANGTAQVYYQQPNSAGVPSSISFTAGTGQLTFSTSSTGSSNPDDTDGNGLPDAWENQYLAKIGNDPNSDPGAVGRTLLQSYQQNLSPWPAATVSNGLQAWFRADMGVILGDSNDVVQWTDVSGNGFHVAQFGTQSFRPALQTGILNLQPALSFNGTNLLQTYGHSDPYGTIDLQNGSSDLTIITVLQPQPAQNFRSGIVTYGGEAGSFGLSQLDVQTNKYVMWWNATDGYSFGNDVPVQAQASLAQVVSVTKAGSAQNSYLNGQLQTTGTEDDQIITTPQIMAVGGYYSNPSIGFKGKIAEVLVYNRALSDAERQQVEAALLAKYVRTNPDSDGNGLPDDWEIQNFGHIGVNPYADPDGDGFTNLQEYQLGTDPNVANPFTGPDTFNGLLMWLKADTGVTADGSGKVSAWTDQSTHGAVAAQSDSTAQPVLVTNQSNGQSVVRFDGSSSLNLPDVINGSPSAEIIAVVKMADNPDQNNTLWQFGVAMGTGYHNEDSFDDFGPGNGNYFTGAPLAAAEQYHIYDVAADNGQSWKSWFNGVLEYSYTDGTYTAWSNSPVIGGTTAHDMLLKGDIAEIIIYDHALSDVEREKVNSYLAAKYNPPAITVPLAPTLSATASSSTSVILSWSGASADLHTITSIERQTGSDPFVTIAQVGDGITYTDTGLTPGQTYQYQIKVSSYAGTSDYSNAVTVTPPLVLANVPSTGMLLWLKADAGITADNNGNVSAWQDLSGLNNSAIQSNAGARPTVVTNQVNNLPVVRFNGIAYLNLPDVMQGNSAGEIVALVKMADNPGQRNTLWQFGTGNGSGYIAQDTFDDFGTGDTDTFTVAPLSAAEQYHLLDVSATTGSWVQRFNGLVQHSRVGETTAFTATPVIGGSVVHDMLLKGDIVEIIVYDHVLSDQDRTALGAYLTTKYAPPTIPVPVTPSLSATATSTSSVTLSWNAQSTDLHTVTSIERELEGGSFAEIAEVSDNIDYLDSGLTPGLTYHYRIKNSSYAGQSAYSNEQVVILPTGSGIPSTGLRIWLSADQGVVTDGNGHVTQWTDRSGNGFDQVLPGGIPAGPLLVSPAVNGQPAVQFDGTSYLKTAAPIDVMAGSSDLTVIAMMMPAANQQPFSTLLDLSSNTAYGFSVAQDGITNKFYLSVDADPVQDERSVGAVEVLAAGQPQVITMVKSGTDARSYLNGLIQSRSSFFQTISDPVAILALGAKADGTGTYNGQIAEILVYNRALSDVERNQAEAVLESKYNGLNTSSSSDVNGLPIAWEIQYFGHTGVDINADPDADGRTNLQEYLAHTDPTDHFNGVQVKLITLVPNGYLDGDGSVSAMVLDTNNNPVPNAPVVFTATKGIHLLASTPSGVGQTQITVFTDSTGVAKAYVIQPTN